MNIPIIRLDWITNSLNHKKLLPYESFTFGIFESLKIGILGFNPKHSQELVFFY